MTPRLRTSSKSLQIPGSRDSSCNVGSSSESTRLIPRRLYAKTHEGIGNRDFIDDEPFLETHTLDRTRFSPRKRVVTPNRRLYMASHKDAAKRDILSYPPRARCRSALPPRDICETCESSADVVSPVPAISFDFTGGTNNTTFTTRKVLEELVQSEDAYISSLSTLRIYYIEPYTLRFAHGLAAPIEMADHYLSCMIEKHTRLLRRLQELSHFCYGLDAFAIAAAQELAANAIDVELYKSYCNIYEDVLKVVKPLMDAQSEEIDFSVQWMQGWETFLESTQPTSRHADLSFFSLIQRPVQRIAKYRLILEALDKCLGPEIQTQLAGFLQRVKDQLVAVNQGVENCEHKRLSSQINNYVNFEGISYAFRVSLEFFGFVKLVGGLYVSWLQEGAIEFEHCAVFLYQSHLVLTQNRKDRKSGKRLPIFILPLLRCCAYSNTKDRGEGIVSGYPLVQKLLFEKEGFQHELVIIFTSKQEQETWLTKLLPLTLITKRKDSANSSQPQLRSLQVFPDHWDRYSMLLRQNMWPFPKSCYPSGEPRIVQIVSNYSPLYSLEISSPVEFQEYPVSMCLSAPEEATFYIKQGERAFLEDDLRHMWSKELSKVSTSRRGLTNLRKSLSWSNMRHCTKSKLRYTQSFHGIAQLQKERFLELDYTEFGDNNKSSYHRHRQGLHRNNTLTRKIRYAMRDLFT